MSVQLVSRPGIVAILTLGLLSACGFRLQGNVPLPAALAIVHIDTNDEQSDFYFGLRKALTAAGTRIADESDGNDIAVVHILDDSAIQRTVTVSTLNVPTEYQLTYRLKFSVSLKGREVIAPEEHSLVRDYNYSESAQLAKEQERAILSQALAHDLVSVVMRRLSSLSGTAAGT